MSEKDLITYLEELKEALDKKEITFDELAKELNYSKTYLRMQLKILTLPKEILDRIREGRVSRQVAIELLAIKDTKAINEFIELVDLGEEMFTVMRVREFKKMLKGKL